MADMNIQTQIAALIPAALLGYLIGSVNAAIIITKYILHSDVRLQGSKMQAPPTLQGCSAPWQD